MAVSPVGNGVAIMQRYTLTYHLFRKGEESCVIQVEQLEHFNAFSLHFYFHIILRGTPACSLFHGLSTELIPSSLSSQLQAPDTSSLTNGTVYSDGK